MTFEPAALLQVTELVPDTALEKQCKDIITHAMSQLDKDIRDLRVQAHQDLVSPHKLNVKISYRPRHIIQVIDPIIFIKS